MNVDHGICYLGYAIPARLLNCLEYATGVWSMRDATGYWTTTIFSFDFIHSTPQSAFACSKLKIETLEQGVKYAQS